MEQACGACYGGFMRRNNKLRRYLSILVAVMMVVMVATPQTVVYGADEYDQLRGRWLVYQTGGNYDASNPHIAVKVTELDAKVADIWSSMDTGAGRTNLWNDASLQYSSTSSEYIYRNYAKLRTMATALKSHTSTYYGNATLKADILSAIDFMHQNWFNASKSSYANWWPWMIGGPRGYSDLVVLMYEDMSAQQITNYTATVDHFLPAVRERDTGANRTDEALIIVLRGIIGKDSAKIAQGRDALSFAGKSVFDYVTHGDGMYEDGSFVQHDDIAYTGTYGAVNLSGIVALMELLSGSTWQVTDPASANVVQWIFDAYEPVLHKGNMADFVSGRGIARDYASRSGGLNVIATIARAAKFASSGDAATIKSMVKAVYEQDVLGDFYSRQSRVSSIVVLQSIIEDGSVAAKPALVQHFDFANMDRTMHRRPDFSFGVSRSSNRIARFEYVNSENGKGWHTGDGHTYLYDGDINQYLDGYWPTVNWKRLPGTTVDARSRNTASGSGTRPTATWSGGTTMDGLYGISGMMLEGTYDTLRAKKSWFMFDDEVVAVGSDIDSTDNRTIETIVENKKLTTAGTNALTVNGVQKPSTLGWSETLSGVERIHLEGNVAGTSVGYYFPEATTLKALRASRTGSWSEINGHSGSTDTITKNYMTLWFDHGKSPVDAAYSYVLLPGISQSGLEAYGNNPDITLIENTPYAHSVRENTLGMTGVNFWTNTYHKSGDITSNKQASVMMKETAGGLTLSVSDPTFVNNGTIEVEVLRSGYDKVSGSDRITVIQTVPTLKVSVDVGGANGANYEATFAKGAATSVFLNPTEDAFVRGGTYGNENYGSASVLTVKNDGNDSYDREAYMTFDYSGFELASTPSAKLKFYVSSVNSDPSRTVQVYATNDASWSQSSLTYNNAPGTSTLVGSVAVTGTGWYELDVTAYVNATMASGLASFKLVNEGAATSQSNFNINSKEASGGRPILEITGVSISDTVYGASADAYVRGGSYGGQNFGTESLLWVKKDANVSYSRQAYVKFDVSGAASKVPLATLRLYASRVNSDPVRTVKVYGTSDTSWTETGITYNTAPAGSTLVASFDVSTTGWYEVDVTDYFKSHMGDGVLSFLLVNEGGASSTNNVDFASREASFGPEIRVYGFK